MASRRWIIGLLAAALAGTAACGDPLAGGSYLGEPLIRLHGRITGDAGTSSIHHPYLGIVWVDAGHQRALEVLAPIEAGPLARDFAIDIWDRPPAGAMVTLCDGTRFAMGLTVAVDDVDGDGSVDLDEETGAVAPPDLLFGIGTTQTLVFLEHVGAGECPGKAFGMSWDAAPGFFFSELDPCTGLPSLEPDPAPLVVELFSPSERVPAELLPACDEGAAAHAVAP